jgi:hypothetical protein
MSRNVIRYALTDRRELVTVGAAIAALVPLSGSAFAARKHSHRAEKKARTDKTFETAAALRDLWIGHIFWVRAVSIATIEKRDATAAIARATSRHQRAVHRRYHRTIIRSCGEGHLLQAPRRALWCCKGLSCSDGRRRRCQAGNGNSVSNVERRENCDLLKHKQILICPRMR